MMIKCTTPTHDELFTLIKEYTQVIRKTRDINQKLKLEKHVSSKYDIAKKASDELREENKVVSSTSSSKPH